MSKFKVYGWVGFASGVPGRQQRIIVAAPSLAAVRRILDASERVGWPGRDWISVTGNDLELETALAEPGAVFAQPAHPIDGREFIRVVEAGS